jgi:hypothetical protein
MFWSIIFAMEFNEAKFIDSNSMSGHPIAQTSCGVEVGEYSTLIMSEK